LTRARAAWIGAAIVVLAAVAYLVRRRRTAPAPVTHSERPVAQVTAAAVEGIPADDVVVDDTWQRFEEASEVPSEDGDVMVVEREQPLATWVRVAIILLALVAFFAVSLIATKQV
jgi:hypothetical protein